MFYSLKKSNNIDTLKFSLFISTMNALYKGVLCLLRRYIQDDRINAAIAGGVSGLAMLIDTKDRRKLMALVIFARSLVIHT